MTANIQNLLINPWLDFIQKRGFSLSMLLLATMILYKLSDAFALSLNSVFLFRHIHFTLDEIATINKLFGLVSSIMGCLVGVTPWIFIFINLIGDGVATDSNPQGVPQFVVWIFVSIFLFFNTFSINMILQYKQIGKWKDYLYGERAYIWLSLLAKTCLAWQVFFGTYQPN